LAPPFVKLWLGTTLQALPSQCSKSVWSRFGVVLVSKDTPAAQMSVADTAAVALRASAPDPVVGLATWFQPPVQAGAVFGAIDGAVWVLPTPAAHCRVSVPPNFAGKISWTNAREVDEVADTANAVAFDRLQSTMAAISPENPFLISLPPHRARAGPPHDVLDYNALTAPLRKRYRARRGDRGS